MNDSINGSDRQIVKCLGRTGMAFFRAFPALRPSQRAAIPAVLAGGNILLACPTASGKTEALLAPMIARVLSRHGSTDRIRLLAIAPTRALVNDLHSRLAPILEELSLGCGRQTSDHRLGLHLPFMLITTPESFDSMLARRSRYKPDGGPAGHDLDGIEAVFVDEAHLFDNSARGDQLLWLLARLQRVKRWSEGRQGETSRIQICAASATVSSPQVLARRLLGANSQVVTVSGAREMLLFSGESNEPWWSIRDEDTIETVLPRVVLPPAALSPTVLADFIWRAMSNDQAGLVRKLLVFVPTRSLCDELTTAVQLHLQSRRQLSVFAHHGSLDKQVRETSEQGFGSARDALLVATSTLEVGVDIGDVDAVVLVGPPADTNGLLQRIGRSGRRLGITRVVAIARSELDRYAMASMLLAARDGICDPVPYGRRWSVCVQQVSSFVRQGPSVGRRVPDVVDLASTVWPDGGAANIQMLVEHLVQQGVLERTPQDRLRFGESWQQRWEGMGMHANIDGGAGGTPVVDALTGETLAHIPLGSSVPGKIALAGSIWRVTAGKGELLLQGAKGDGTHGAIKYGARKGPVSRAFARHVALGMKFDDEHLVSINIGADHYLFHFGGSVYERLLTELLGGLQTVGGLGGIALCGNPKRPFSAATVDHSRVESLLAGCILDSPGIVAPGPYHGYLPEHLQLSAIKELVPAKDFIEWIGSRRVHELTIDSPQASALISLLRLPPAGPPSSL